MIAVIEFPSAVTPSSNQCVQPDASRSAISMPLYIAVIHEQAGHFDVSFPDVPGLVTAGDTFRGSHRGSRSTCWKSPARTGPIRTARPG